MMGAIRMANDIHQFSGNDYSWHIGRARMGRAIVSMLRTWLVRTSPWTIRPFRPKNANSLKPPERAYLQSEVPTAKSVSGK